MLDDLDAAVAATKPINWTLPVNTVVFDDTHYALSAMYFAFMLAVLVIILYKAVVRKTLRALWLWGFYLFLVIGLMIRGVWSAMAPSINNGMLPMTNRANFYLNMLPSFFFMGVYIILLFLFAEIYHGADSLRKLNIYRLRRPLAITLAVMWGIFAVLFVADIIGEPTTWIAVSVAQTLPEHIVQFYLGFLYLGTCGMFLVYGVLFLWHLRNKMHRAEGRKALQHRMTLLTIIVVIVMAARGIMLFLSYFVGWAWIPYMDILYFSLLEITPLVLILVILLSGPRTPPTQENERLLNEN